MKTARRSSWEQGIRINYVAPCYIRSAIRSAEYEKSLMEKGVVFGEQEDVAACMMRIACDRSIDGKIRSSTLCPPPLFPFFFFFAFFLHFLLVMQKRSKIGLTLFHVFAGRSLMIVPRSMAKEGFMDTDREDFRDTEKDAYFKQTQEAQLVIIQDRWRDDYVVPKYK